jgi:hypothetical protein
MAKKTTKSKPYRVLRFGVMNHLGEIWTPVTFQSHGDAEKYLEKMRPVYGGLTKKHKVVPVRVTISIAQ